MNRIKEFTQSITIILVIVMSLVFLFVVAWIMKVTGLIQEIDSLYEGHRALFWALLVVTRIVYGFGGFITLFFTIDALHNHGYFWFKPDTDSSNSKTEGEGKDKSKWVFIYTIWTLGFGFIGEIVIRLFTTNIRAIPYWGF